MTILNEQSPAAKSAGKSDSSHWYGYSDTLGWHPLYTPDKNFTLREARKLQAAGMVAVPSVTTYIGELRKRQVEIWQQEQVAGVCYDFVPHTRTLPRDEWIELALDRASNASGPAQKLGSQIHAAIELAVGGKDYDAAMDIYVQPVLRERENWGLISIAQEKCVGHLKLGYGGKVDDICEGMIIVDYKSRGKVEAYPTDWCQIAAYGYAEFGEAFFDNGSGLAFPISTKEPGIVKPVMKTGAELRQAFEAFLGLTGTWRYFHNYDPRFCVGDAGKNNQ